MVYKAIVGYVEECTRKAADIKHTKKHIGKQKKGDLYVGWEIKNVRPETLKRLRPETQFATLSEMAN